MTKQRWWQPYLLRVISKDETGPLAFLIRLMLSILELVYWVLLKLAMFFSRRYKLPAPVISVGNITAGGTGKTPTVVWLAGLLQREGFTPAILSRGYGGKLQDDGVCFKGSTRSPLSAAETGDEPYLLSELLPEALIVVGRERYRNGLRALQNHPEIDLFILDDGFQHWNLIRELDIVMIDATRPFGNRHLLPRGLLREPLSGLKRAGIICLTRTENVAETLLTDLKNEILAINPQALIAVVKESPSYLLPLPGSNQGLQPAPAADFLTGRMVGAITAIGNPRQFLASLERMGAKVGYFKAYQDHCQWEEAEIIELITGLAENGFSELIVTAKDGVKLEPFAAHFRKNGLACYILSLDYVLTDQAVIRKIIETVKLKTNFERLR